MTLLRGLQADYPPESIQRGQEGYVIVDLTIDDRGHPVDARVRHSSGFVRLDGAAVHAVRQWIFSRAASAQMPLRQISVRIGFRLRAQRPAFQFRVRPFEPGAVARMNASAQVSTRAVPAPEELRRLVTGLRDQIDMSLDPDKGAQSVRQEPVVFSAVEAGQPAGWEPWETLDHSEVLSVRLIGTITSRGPDLERFLGTEVDQHHGDSALFPWYILAVQQEQSTSEWLIGGELGGNIKAVYVLRDGPPCASAPDGAACNVPP